MTAHRIDHLWWCPARSRSGHPRSRSGHPDCSSARHLWCLECKCQQVSCQLQHAKMDLSMDRAQPCH